MNVREAMKNDRDQVLGLLDELIAEVNRKSGRPPKYAEEQEKRHTMYDELISRNDVKVFVAEENGELYGMADLFILPVMRRGYHQGHVEDIVVAEKSRGKGVGSSLMTYIKDYCKRNDIKVIKLNSGFELVDAHRFYEKHGGVHTEKMFRFDI